jgi:CDP-diacylglycerol--serine O-phosphatidyltransferase
MNFIRNQIPNFITCLNLVCGLAGIVLLSEQGIRALPQISLLVFLAGVADFFDGFSARLLRSVSAIGKDLDSLADAITFGVLPGMASYVALKECQAGDWSWMALILPVFSVIRLARFNNDPGQSTSFKGVPTPATAFFIVFLLEANFSENGWLSGIRLDSSMLSAIIAISSALLLAPFRIIALKFKSYGWKENLEKYALLASIPVFIAFFQKDSVPLIYFLYLYFSLIYGFRTRRIPV